MNNHADTKKIIPWIIATALFMETLDITIINTAIPSMALSFKVNPIDLKLALTSYLLSLALFIPVSGWVADKWGTKRTFVFALLVFTVSSIGCAISRCLSELVIGRVVQGMGGAFMMPVGRLIMLRTFFKSELLRVMNFVTMPALLGPLLGPLVGGFITTYYSWPWIFYINVPIGLLGILGTLYYIKNCKIETVAPFDMMGFLLFGVSLSGLFFSFETINEPSIPTYVVVVVALGALVGFLLFYWRYQKTKEPVLDLKLFSIRTFLIAALGNVWVRLGISSVSFLLPLLLQMGYGLSPVDSGMLTCVLTLGMVSTKFFNKTILQQFGFRKMLSITSVLTGISIISLALINKANPILIVPLVFINGMVTSLQFTGMNVLYYVDVNQLDMGHATSISGTLQQLSMGLGIVLSTLVLQFFIGWDRELILNNPFPFRWTFLVMGVIALLSVLIFLKLKPNDGQEMT